MPISLRLPPAHKPARRRPLPKASSVKPSEIRPSYADYIVDLLDDGEGITPPSTLCLEQPLEENAY